MYQEKKRNGTVIVTYRGNARCSMYENKTCRDGRVTKEELDACSTCDLHCADNTGLSEESRAQLDDLIGRA